MSDDYLDFELDLGPLSGEDTFPLTLLQSPCDSSSVDPVPTEVKLFFDKARISEQINQFWNAVRNARRISRKTKPSDLAYIEQFGMALYTMLFQGNVLREFKKAREYAKNQNHKLRLRLNIRDPILGVLPWEYMYGNDDKFYDFLCLTHGVSLTRSFKPATPYTPTHPDYPINILGMASSPKDQPELNIRIEKENLEAALKQLIDHGLIKLEWLPNATWRDLLNATSSQTSWDIFHFMGYGAFNESNERGLLFKNDDDESDFRSADDIVRLLSPEQFRLITLNACYGAYAGHQNIFSSVAAALLRRGTPSVIAMQHEIDDGAAIEFSYQFYGAIAKGLSLDTAILTSRLCIDQEFRDADWGVPTLSMQTTNGNLFDIPEISFPAVQTKYIQASSAIYKSIIWPEITEIQDIITKSHKEWLKEAGLASNPFTCKTLESASGLIYHELDLPKFNDIFDTESSSCIHSNVREDYQMAYVGFLKYICNRHVHSYTTDVIDRIFPIPIPFSSEYVSQQKKLLEDIAQNLAIWWREILVLNPKIFLELNSNLLGQLHLTEMLVWYLESIDAATNIFFEASNQANHELIDACIEQMQKIWQNTSRPILSDQRLRRWLQVRPPEHDYTYLVMNFTQDGAGTVPMDSILNSTLRRLETKDVRIKAFIPSIARGLFSDFPDIQLKWEPNSLSGELTRRIQNSVASGDANFNALFEFSFEDYHQMLVEISDGSLGQMLRIGNEIVRNHVRNQPEKFMLADNDWAAVVQTDTSTSGNNEVTLDGRGVASGGNIKGSIIMTGDHNTIITNPDNQDPQE